MNFLTLLSHREGEREREIAYPQLDGLDSLQAINNLLCSWSEFGDNYFEGSSRRISNSSYSQCLRGSSSWGADLESQFRWPWLWRKGQPWHRGCTPGKRPRKYQSHGKSMQKMPSMPRIPKCRRLPTSLGKKKTGKNSHKQAVGKATAKTTRTSRGASSMPMISMLSRARAGKNHKSGQENIRRSGHHHPPVGRGTRILRTRAGARGSS